MLRSTSGIGRQVARLVFTCAALVGLALLAGPARAEPCWSNYPRAEKAFRDGIEAFKNEDWELAIDLLREARESRMEPDGNCPVQLYGRSLENKAYYLPYYYLGKAFFEGRELLEDPGFACQEAKRYADLSLKFRDDTYDIYRRRFRSHLSDFDDIDEVCGVSSASTISPTGGRLATVARRERAGR